MKFFDSFSHLKFIDGPWGVDEPLFMDKLERHIMAASGYLELGMPRDAAAELRELGAAERKDWRVLALRVAICQDLGSWEQMLDISRYLACVQPDESQWAICTAHAMQKIHSVEAAREMLLRARRNFPEEAEILYHLARYEAQLGNLDQARKHLRAAIKLNPAHRTLARNNPELAAVMRKG